MRKFLMSKSLATGSIIEMALFAENSWLTMGRSQFKTKAPCLQAPFKSNSSENQPMNSVIRQYKGDEKEGNHQFA